MYTKPNVLFKCGSLDKGCVEMRTKKIFKLSLYENIHMGRFEHVKMIMFISFVMYGDRLKRRCER